MMKTHELAKALNHLSRILRAGPNIELDDLVNLDTYVASRPKPSRDESANKGMGLALLAQMASYNKRDLVELAHSLNIPIEIRSADAVRDVLGKILKFIQDNPDVRNRLMDSGITKQSGNVSSLARALAILINQP